MTIIEVTAICGVTGSIGLILGWGITWGKTKQMLQSLVDGHEGLKKEFIEHRRDLRIHIDPDRDQKSASDFRSYLNDHFAELREQISRLDGRCEKRGTDCAGHFGVLERRIAAATGKSNGDPK